MLPRRKQIRLSCYDYSSPGAYFITICTHEKRCILSDITVGAIRESPLQQEDEAPSQKRTRSLLDIAIGFLKMNSSKQIHMHCPNLIVWQRSYHDHIIRNENDYREIWNYIDTNPGRWRDDCFFIG